MTVRVETVVAMDMYMDGEMEMDAVMIVGVGMRMEMGLEMDMVFRAAMDMVSGDNTKFLELK